MCECIKETEDRFKKHLKETKTTFKELEDFEVSFENKAIMFSSGKTELAMPIVVSWEHKAKSGRLSTKRKKYSFTIDYCPFCGEKKQNSNVD